MTTLSPKHPRWDEFVARLNNVVLTIGCRHDTSCAETIMCSMGGIDVDGSLAFFRQHGGYCDCEIIFNVVLAYEEDDYLEETNWGCADCKVNTSEIDEYFMVRDEVWQQAGGGEDMLCIGCLESRLGRKLQQIDFSDCPLNREEFPRSARLKNCLTLSRN